MRLGSDLRTLLLRPVSTSHRLSISAQKGTDQSLRGSHTPPVSRRSIVTASFRLTLPHHIPQEGLLSSSSPVYEIQFGNSTRFIIVERSRSVCQGGRGSTCFRTHLRSLLPCQGAHNLIPTFPLLVLDFIESSRGNLIPLSHHQYVPFGIRRFNITSRHDAYYNTRDNLLVLLS